MPAYIVDSNHIHALVTAGLRLGLPGSPLRWFLPAGPDAPLSDGEYAGNQRTLTRDTAGRVGAMLADQNQRSVNYRYREDDIEEPYEFRELPGHPDPLTVLRAIAGYEYQACETRDWEHTEAHAFIRALEQRAIRALPGWDDSPGRDIDSPNVFLTAAARKAARA